MVWLSAHPEPARFLLLLEQTRNRDLSIDNLRRLESTRREVQVLLLVGQGKPPVAIAEPLGMSDLTIKKHLQNIYRKSGVQNRLSAIIYALEKLGILAKQLGSAFKSPTRRTQSGQRPPESYESAEPAGVPPVPPGDLTDRTDLG